MTTVPFRLRRTDSARPISALVLFSSRPADLLDLVARLREPSWPLIYPVAGAFLVKLRRPVESAFPLAIRLRALADNLFLPADAELEPGLLPDEAAGLVRSRGLVFLPGGCVLAFAPDQPLQPSMLLSAPRAPDRRWQPLPPRPPRADQLREVTFDRPDDVPDLIVERGGEGVGTEDPRPAFSGPGRSAAGQAAVALGRGLVWLANLLRWEGLARLGARVVASALDRVPRLSESLLGRQQAALRWLLREFREGSIEAALRRALPLGSEGDRGNTAAGNAELPRHDPRFSLRGLLADGKSPRSIWFGGGEVQVLLAAEYRKAAVAAAARGDHRRAAFIYAKLLKDFRLAAAVLERGGNHRDAAILYLEKLRDSTAAAKAFEAAGMFDRALQLYRQAGNHTAAGDLLLRVGDEDEALAAFTLAADELVARGDYFAAGNLFQKHTSRHDLARTYFAAGWSARPARNDVQCLLRLAELSAAGDSPETLLTLAAEAEAFVDSPGRETDAAQFYDLLARFADRPHLAAVGEELRDRSLLGLARQFRRRSAERTNPGNVVSALLGRSGLWHAAVVSDADFAFKAALKTRSSRDDIAVRDPGPLRLGGGPLTAACAAPETGILFAGFGGGTLVAFDPVSGATTRLRREEAPGWPVVAVATDPRGNSVVALRLSPTGQAELCGYQRVNFARSPFTYTARTWRLIPASAGCGLTPAITAGTETSVGLLDVDSFVLLAGPDLVPLAHVRHAALRDTPNVGLLLPHLEKGQLPHKLRASGSNFYLESSWDEPWSKIDTAWTPALPPKSSLHAPVLSALWADRQHVHLAGVDDSGATCYSVLRQEETTYKAVSTARWDAERRVAAVIVAPGRLAAVWEGGVEFFRATGSKLTVIASTAIPLPGVSSCFFSPPGNELLILTENGDLRRLQVPV
jgi:tetratricopeptide (TPR) repeat protein